LCYRSVQSIHQVVVVVVIVVFICFILWLQEAKMQEQKADLSRRMAFVEKSMTSVDAQVHCEFMSFCLPFYIVVLSV
jgi:type II secretory pathway component PulF